MKMRNKLFLAALASVVVVVPVMVAPAEAAVEKTFKDVSKANPYFDIIHEMRDLNIINGYEDGTFRPGESVSRKHAAALVSRTKDLPITEGFVKFKDVSEGNAYFNDIKKLQQAGIFGPDAKGNFNPDKPVTRGEMAKILSIAFNISTSEFVDISDVNRYDPDSVYIRALYVNGISTGDNGLFKPNAPLTRAHYAVFMERAMKYEDAKLTIEDLDSMTDEEVLALTDDQLAQIIIPFNHYKPAFPDGVTDLKSLNAANFKEFNTISVQNGADRFLSSAMKVGPFNKGIQKSIGAWSETMYGMSPKEVIKLINKTYEEGVVISSNDIDMAKRVVVFFDYETMHLRYSVAN